MKRVIVIGSPGAGKSTFSRQLRDKTGLGLPFAILQRKRDITSAMISHGLVDAVRFTLMGI